MIHPAANNSSPPSSLPVSFARSGSVWLQQGEKGEGGKGGGKWRQKRGRRGEARGQLTQGTSGEGSQRAGDLSRKEARRIPHTPCSPSTLHDRGGDAEKDEGERGGCMRLSHSRRDRSMQHSAARHENSRMGLEILSLEKKRKTAAP